jgi:hypothetical protein
MPENTLDTTDLDKLIDKFTHILDKFILSNYGDTRSQLHHALKDVLVEAIKISTNGKDKQRS